MDSFTGYHCEWNLGSPGGWKYQRLAQRLGKLAWSRLAPRLNLPFDLDYDHPLLDPVPEFAAMLLRAHRQVNGSEPPFIVLLAEIETLQSVVENARMVQYLDRQPDISAALAAPEHLTLHRGRVSLEDRPISLIYMDFNCDTLVNIGRKTDITPVVTAIQQGRLVNPRGMEPVGAKGVFEAITGSARHLMTPTTVQHTPWTRVFQPRATTGPEGESIPDLLAWTRRHFTRLILKPAHGYSGQGIFVGPLTTEVDEAIETALSKGNYIVQSLVPLKSWQELYPIPADGAIRIASRQTDFRSFITDTGLIGFLGRFGGIPTNVGSGGGSQPLAFLQGEMSLRAADLAFNQALEQLPLAFFQEVQAEVEEEARKIGFVYLLGPIPISLKPRMLTLTQVADLGRYAQNLWKDAMTLEKLWQTGELEHVVQYGKAEQELVRQSPWEGRPALMVSDGLFNFGSGAGD
jgi:hypothetical protein